VNISQPDGSTAGRGLLLVMMEPEAGFDAQLNRWYREEHFAERLSVPGFLGGRRFEAVEGGPRYLALYDMESVDVLGSEPYRAVSEPPSDWTREVRRHVQITRNVYRDITPAVDLSRLPDRQPAEKLWETREGDV
jgi:hypothetical protein